MWFAVFSSKCRSSLSTSLLELLLLHPVKFLIDVFPVLFVPGYFRIFSLTTGCSSVYCLISMNMISFVSSAVLPGTTAITVRRHPTQLGYITEWVHAPAACSYYTVYDLSAHSLSVLF